VDTPQRPDGRRLQFSRAHNWKRRPAESDIVARIAARPHSVDFEPSSTALTVVDMQHDFASDGGMFRRAGIDVSDIRRIVPVIQSILVAARRIELPVCYLRMGFGEDCKDAGLPDGPTWVKHLPMHAGDQVTAPDGSPSRILIRGTWNTAIIDELEPRSDDMVIDKHRYSGFVGTDLEARLRARGISTLLFVGATTSVCVESTVRDAMMRDFHCLVVEDAVAEPIGAGMPRSNHDASLLVLELLFASVTSSASVIDALNALEPAAP
jgi:ureidoacrylate peracid hydrolase